MRSVASALSFTSSSVGRVTHDAPYLDVPAIRQEIGMRPQIPRQLRLVDVRNAVLGQPVVNAALVGRTDLVSIGAGESLPGAETVWLDGNAGSLQAGDDRQPADAVSLPDLAQVETFGVEGCQFLDRRDDGCVNAVAGLLDGRRLNTQPFAPVAHGSRVNAVESGNALVTDPFDVEHSVKLSRRGRGDATIRETGPRRAPLDPIGNQPAPHFRLADTVFLPDATGRAAVVNIESVERFSIWSHGVSISDEIGTLPRLGEYIGSALGSIR